MRKLISAAFAACVVGAAVSGCSDDEGPKKVARPSVERTASVDGGVATPVVVTACRFDSDCPSGDRCRFDRDRGRKVCIGCREDRDCCDDGTATCGFVCTAERCVRGAPEACNGLDDDRDGQTDEGFDLTTDAANCGRCARDCDAVIAHVRSDGTACTGGICQLVVGGCADGFFDRNSTASDGCEYACTLTKGGVEAPDGVDNNCDGAVDEGFECENGGERPCGAGTGVCEEGVQTCRVGRWTACEGALGSRDETCNGLDDDCDGDVDEAFDLATDAANCGRCGRSCAAVFANADVACTDGWCTFQACHADARDRDDNRDNGCEPCATVPVLDREICGNNTDDDCDGSPDDGCPCDPGDERRCGLDPLALDDVGRCRAGMQVCVAAADGSASLGACVGAVTPTTEACNGADDDCDGSVPANEADADRDGYRACAGDCDDADRDVNPDGFELCDGRDDDCDGLTDEDPFSVGAPCRGLGTCGIGRLECASLVSVRCSTDAGGSADRSRPETCDRTDEDCDGAVDNVAAAALAGDPANCGACGVSCALPNAVTSCADGACVVEECVIGYKIQPDQSCLRCDVWVPRVESCDAGFLDEDCDGRRNEDCGCSNGQVQPCGLDLARNGVGICHVGTQTCVGGAWGNCLGAVTPQPETCNGLDDDCDGIVPADERDADRDGYTPCASDCDDADRTVSPESRESCNGRDDDCDGVADEDFFVGIPCTGVGGCGAGVYECNGTAAFRCSTTPGGSADRSRPETCDRTDEDCDGAVDDVAAAVVAADVRNCGACGVACAFPNAAAVCAAGACVRGVCAAGFVDADRDPATGCEYRCSPTVDLTDGPIVQCDGADNDCDGSTDEGCACRDGATRPCAPDAPACDLAAGTCRGECRIGVQVCAGGAWAACTGTVFPVAERCNGLDDDCTGGIPVNEQDRDDDRVMGCDGDCDDGNVAVLPGVAERCNGLDDDCDGSVDEGFSVGAPCNSGPSSGPACRAGRLECNPADSTAPARCSTAPGGSAYPAPAPVEACDNDLDDDCDGSVDEGCGGCVPGTHRDCGLDPALNGVGTCRVGTQTCAADRTWGTCDRAQGPLPETCNGLDDDCDNIADDGFTLATDAANCGACGNDCRSLPNVAAATCAFGACGGLTCASGWFNLDGTAANGCEYGCFPTNGGVERCGDGFDNDCDGSVDDGCGACVPGSEELCGLDPTLHGVGTCRVGIRTCGPDRTWGACVGAVTPQPESCNGLDDDCDNIADDGFTLATDVANCGACGNDCRSLPNVSGASCAGGTCGGFVCRVGFSNLDGDPSNGCEYGCFPTNGGVERCGDDTDNDCDGSTDENCGECAPGAQEICGLDPALHGVGTCRVGIRTCGPNQSWGACRDATAPVAETCDGADEDCDGSVDEDFDLLTDAANCGACGNDCAFRWMVWVASCNVGSCAVSACVPGWFDLNGDAGDGCEYGCFRTNGGVEQCDRIDNDCNGIVDDAAVCNPPAPATAPVTYAVTVPAGFPVDATIELCSSFATGSWACGDYPLAVTANADGTTTVSTTGTARTGRHVFNLCTANCADPALASYVVVREADGTLTQAASPTVTFAGRPVPPPLVLNARGDGGNWYAEFVVP